MKTRALAISPGQGTCTNGCKLQRRENLPNSDSPHLQKPNPPRHTFIRPALKRKEDEDLAPKDFMHGSTLEGTPEERLSFLRYGMGVEC